MVELMSMALVPVLPAINFNMRGKMFSLSTVFGMDHNDKISDFFSRFFPVSLRSRNSSFHVSKCTRKNKLK